MKTYLKVVFFVLITGTLSSCHLFDDAFLKKGENSTHKPFRAEFFTEATPTDDPRVCDAPFDVYVNQEGEGIALGMGNFELVVDFCVDFSTFEYINGIGTFHFSNGDEIYFTIAGQIMPSSDPDYNLMFMDPFVITGGTGRFEGVTGSGMTNSFVKLFEGGGDHVDHIWEGEIIYPD